MSSSHNVIVESLTFKDDSCYRGQVLPRPGDHTPHGFGVMTTSSNFEMRGYFKNGKAFGPGRFRAPNGDLFYGNWNRDNKRCGQGLSLLANGKRLIEKYDAFGSILKRLTASKPRAHTIRWERELDLQATLAGEGACAGPCARNGHSATLVEGRTLVVFGGHVEVEGRTSHLNDTHFLDVTSMTWLGLETSGSVPPPMHSHRAVAYGSKLIIIGGQAGLEVSSAVYVLDLKTGIWTCPIAKGLHFVNHTATLVGHRIFVIVQASVCALDLQSFTWQQCEVNSRALPLVGRSIIHHSAVAVGTMIYVFGGKMLGLKASDPNNQWQKCSNQLRILHTDHLAWEVPVCQPPLEVKTAEADFTGLQLGAWDTPRGEHSAVLMGSELYIFGGWTSSAPKMNVIDQSFLDDVQVLNVETMQWLSPFIRHPLTPPRGLHSATAVGDRIFVFGGHNFSMDAMDAWCLLYPGEDAAIGLKKKKTKPQSTASRPASSGSRPASSGSRAASSGSKALQSQPQALAAPAGLDQGVAAPTSRRSWDKPVRPASAAAGTTDDGKQKGAEFVTAGSGSVMDFFKGGSM